ncbi:MAG: YitT family protein [Bacilli bacterium]
MVSSIRFKNVFFILLGTAIFSFGIVNINMQNKLAEGGLTGITLLLFFIFGISPAFTNLLLNIPLFIIGWRQFSRTGFIYTVLGTVAVSVWIKVFEVIPFRISLEDDLLLAALYAGGFIGVGLGIVFRYGGTTGGVDIIARLVKRRFGWSMGRTMFLFDLCVIATSLVYLDLRQAMYTLVVVFVGAQVIDFIQDASYGAKGVTIISEKYERIARAIMEDLERGVTSYKGEGLFTNAERRILYCVVAKSELSRMKSIVLAHDPHAFVVVSDVHDVLGEGFTLDSEKKPIRD